MGLFAVEGKNETGKVLSIVTMYYMVLEGVSIGFIACTRVLCGNPGLDGGRATWT
jgi:hypothetical protein